jgi:hypothetical protein
MIAPLQAKLVGVQISQVCDHRLERGHTVWRRYWARLRPCRAAGMLSGRHHAAFRFGDCATRSRFTDRAAVSDRPSEAAGASVASGSFE